MKLKIDCDGNLSLSAETDFEQSWLYNRFPPGQTVPLKAWVHVYSGPKGEVVIQDD